MQTNFVQKSKGFLRLNNKKIAIFFLILTLSYIPFIGFFPFNGPCLEKIVGCRIKTYYFYNPIFWLPLQLEASFSEGGIIFYFGAPPYQLQEEAIEQTMHLENPIVRMILLIIIPLLYMYVLSCLVIYFILRKLKDLAI